MQKRMRALLLGFSTAAAAGCAAANAGAGDPAVFVISVRNPSTVAAQVRVCPPTTCLPRREVAAGAVVEFRLSPDKGTRAVVDAMIGDRVVDQQPVDFQPGERYSVVLAIP
jgi:hypothetical protein